MYSYFKKNIIINKEKGFTLLELMVACAVFGLLLFAVYATLDIGLKCWQLGATKSDLHQKAEIVLNRIVREYTYSTTISVQIANDGIPNNSNRYICFETALDKNDNTFQPDPNTYGSPCWQAHILYYMAPDPSDSTKYNIYRNYVPAIPSSQPDILSSIGTNINITSGDNVRTVVKDIDDINFVRSGDMITIYVSFKRHIRSNASVAFSPGGDASRGTEVVQMSASVRAKN